jgi:hypothetical protein
MRHQRFTPQQVIEAIRRCHGMLTQVAVSLRCQRATVRNYLKRYPRVAAVLREERERVLDLCELKLSEAIEAGEPWAICFYLKTQGRHRGYTVRHEIKGAGAVPGAVFLAWNDVQQSDNPSGSSAA